MISDSLNDHLKQHYSSRSDLGSAILLALSEAGKDIDNLRPTDLAPVDEFHIRGREATLELAQMVGLDANKQVLDVGCGLGGPSRCIAREFRCHVTGIDLTDEYCHCAALLTERIGLSHLVKVQQGDALNLPFPDESFDVVWTQHAAMNIPDKPKLYREMNRVLRPGGAVAIYDALSGPKAPPLLPVPWARGPETNFLVTPEELRNLLQEAGFTIVRWEDTTEVARTWFEKVWKKIQERGEPPVSPRLLFGEDYPVMIKNLKRNLDEGRIRLAQIVATK